MIYASYLWSGTDNQFAPPGNAAPPEEAAWAIASPQPTAPELTSSWLWLWEQHEIPLLQAVDDGEWTPFFSTGEAGTVRADPTAWDNDFLPTPPAVTPQEDWYSLPLIGVPVVIPPPRGIRQDVWQDDERVVPGVAHPPESDAINWLMTVIPSPLEVPMPYVYEQHDWWGGGPGTGGNVLQLQTLQMSGSMAIP